MFAGNIKVPVGPHVASGPDVAQAWNSRYSAKQQEKENE